MVVYDVKTGEKMECESVDARELIASGQYSKSKPEDKPKRGRKPKLYGVEASEE